MLKEFPELSNKKHQKYASTLSELNILVQSIKEPTIIIIDGLDHIDRVYDFYNYTDLSKNETQIIEILENIECTENVSILLASQPISKLHSINGFHAFEIPKWNKKEVNSLLKRHNINNSFINKTDLSQILLDKSEGNPLYLTYLIKELQKATKINERFINNLPAYSYNLAEYYSYILAKLNTRESLPRVIAGVNFYLSKNELREITGDGDFVEDALLTLSPILKTNISLNGYIIYHESFRRFVLDVLKDKSVSIEMNVFKPTIEWFKSKNLFSYSKAFRYGLQYFHTCHEYQEIERYIVKDFIVNSVTWGQPWVSIENNIQILAQTAINTHNFDLLVIVNELFKTIGIAENSYDSSFISYIECMGMVKGFEQVSNFLSFEGEPALDNLRQGLQVCYLSSDHKAIAPWNLYFDYFKKVERIKLEDFKYYVRYLLLTTITSSFSSGLTAARLFCAEL